MKVCLACGATFDSADWKCRECNALPRFIGGYPAFSPELSQVSEGFRESFFGQLASLEEKHFWFRSRNRLIIWALQKYFPAAKKFLEIGCGTAFVLSGIEQAFPGLSLYGSEIYSTGLRYAAGRLKKAELFQMDARKIPFENEFDVIGAFDVLEHIEQDELVLSQMCRALCRGGGIIVTVPQHKFLWSRVDERACHIRRYNISELKDKVEKSGFEILRVTSFMFFLFPFMILQRYKLQKSVKEFEGIDELKINRALNLVFEKIVGLERTLLKSGMDLPLGGSLLLIGRKI